jgi:hypothetical protein
VNGGWRCNLGQPIVFNCLIRVQLLIISEPFSLASLDLEEWVGFDLSRPSRLMERLLGLRES